MRVMTKFLMTGLAVLALSACQGDSSDRAGVSGQTRTTGTADIGGPFTLVDTTGTPVSEVDLQGKPHLVYFGFAYCPDICPTALQKLGAAQTLLKGAGDDIGYVLITVDPERDTTEKLAQYIAFDPFPKGLRGFTGTVEQIDAVKSAYKVYTQKSSTDGGPIEAGSTDYTVDHSDIVYFMGADGKYLNFFDARSTPQDIALGVRQALMKSEK